MSEEEDIREEDSVIPPDFLKDMAKRLQKNLSTTIPSNVSGTIISESIHSERLDDKVKKESSSMNNLSSFYIGIPTADFWWGYLHHLYWALPPYNPDYDSCEIKDRLIFAYVMSSGKYYAVSFVAASCLAKSAIETCDKVTLALKKGNQRLEALGNLDPEDFRRVSPAIHQEIFRLVCVGFAISLGKPPRGIDLESLTPKRTRKSRIIYPNFGKQPTALKVVEDEK